MQQTALKLQGDLARSAWYCAAMEQLVGVVGELSHARSLDEIMKVVRRAARELTGADGATFVLRDDDKCFYAEENAVSPLWKGQRFPLTTCISGWVMLNKTPAVIEDIFTDPRIPVDAYRPTFVKSLAMVPIRRHDPVAAIGNYWAQKRQPRDEEVAILQTLADVTAVALENVELYRRLEEKVQALEEANAELRRFAWIASHDLKSPLYSISNLSHWAEEDAGQPLPPKTVEHLAALRRRIGRMENLLKDLLAYTIAADGKAPDEDLATGREILAGVLESMNVPKGFTIEADAAFETLKLPRFDMERIFANLVGNAIKHHDREQGRIRVGVREDETQYVFTISDDGPGIPADAQKKVFDMFQTLKPRDKVEGSGMGLAIVRKILNAHGDDIRVESSGRGAAFTFTWRKSLALPD